MPYAPPTLSEEEKKKKEQGQGVSVAGASNMFSSNIPGQDAGTHKSSGQYANIQKYLGANQDQANQMGQNLASDVENKAKESQALTESFAKQAPKVEAYNPSDVIGKVGELTDAEKALYKEQKKTGGYTGPENLDKVSGYSEAQKAAEKARQGISQIASEQGQQELLKQKYQRPDYSAGQTKLDQALLQYSQPAKQGFENIRQKYSDIGKLFDESQLSVGEAVNKASKQALANKQAFNPAEQAAREALLNPIQQRAAQANIDNPALISRIMNDAQDEILSDETLRILGLGEGQNIYNLNIGSYLNPNKTEIGLNQAANKLERQKYAQLASLFDDQTMTQIDQNGQEITPMSLDQSRFLADVAAKKAEYENAYNTQMGTVLNPSYLADGLIYDNWIPRINGRPMGTWGDFSNATARDVENKWIPALKGAGGATISGNPAGFAQAASAAQRSLDEWKAKYQPNRKIKKG